MATVAELWAVYERDYVKRRGLKGVEWRWRNLEPFFARLRPERITQREVDLYEDRRSAGQIGRPACPATVRLELSTLRACLNWCADPRRKLISADAVPQFDLPAAGQPRDRWLNDKEVSALFAGARGNPRLEMFLWLALHTAARKTAIYELTWDRVDFDTRMIHYAVPGRAQTSKRRVSVPISAKLLAILADARTDHGLVIGSGGDLWRAVQAAAVRGGLAVGTDRRRTGISPHTLRHTAATRMARRGVPLYTIAGVLGNSLAMVERVYAKHAPEALAAAVEKIG